MNHEELFVGTVSIVLGVAGLIAAIGNWDGYYQLDKVRWFEAVAGRRWARVAYAVIGTLLIVLGVAIALGFGPNKSSAQTWRVRSSSRAGASPFSTHAVD